jgi:hypothetical protein
MHYVSSDSILHLFYAGQLITYSALGLCAPGEAHQLVDRGDNTVRPLSPFILRSFNCSAMNSTVASTW